MSQPNADSHGNGYSDGKRNANGYSNSDSAYGNSDGYGNSYSAYGNSDRYGYGDAYFDD